MKGSISTLRLWFGITAVTVGLCACGALLDGPSDIQAAQDVAADVADVYDAQAELRAAAPGSARQQIAAQYLCDEARGPNSEARFLPDGAMVCTSRLGLVKL